MRRREFLALAGAAGLALGPGRVMVEAAEMRFDGVGGPRRPAWVRRAERPSLGIDDSIYTRFDKRRCAFTTRSGGSLALYLGEARERALLEQSARATAHMLHRAGFRARDRALVATLSSILTYYGGPNSPNQGLLTWSPLPGHSFDPLLAGGWEHARAATAEVKAAARFFGAAVVGIGRLDRRHVYSHDLDGKPIVFEDSALPAEHNDRRVIPTRCRQVVVVAVKMSNETVKRAPTALATAASHLSYTHLIQLCGLVAQFIRARGYLAIPSVNDTAANVPLAVDAGLGELGRHNRLITPEYGSMIRIGKVFTDAPLLADGPIAAGITDFCRTCAKCAEACPTGALSFAPGPSYAVKGPWNNPGHEAWFEDAALCQTYLRQINTTCMICLSVCPFSKKRRAAAHSVVKATVANTAAFNAVLRSIDDAFGYGGQKSPDAWWELDLPPFGTD